MIILDAGHGYDTYGKASPVWQDGTQLLEYEFNRDIVKRIHTKLDQIHIDSIILVPEAIDISLKVRCNRANEIFKKHPESFLISVHGNMGGGSGWEVWTSPGETKSDKIASIFMESAKTHLAGFKMRSDYSDGDPDKESKFYILVHTLCPAVLTENLFYDNWKDYQFMNSYKGRETITDLHIDAIVNYLIQ